MARQPEGTRIEDGEVGAESAYKRKTDKEIRELALACRAGTVFGTWNIPESEKDNIGMVFMPILLSSDIQKKTMIRDEIVHFYGHLSESFHRSINGMPCFHTCHFLNREDTDRLSAALKALAEFMGDSDGD